MSLKTPSIFANSSPFRMVTQKVSSAARAQMMQCMQVRVVTNKIRTTSSVDMSQHQATESSTEAMLS